MKRIFMTGIAVALLGVIAAFPSVAAAYQGDPAVQGPNCSAERHEAMQNAFTERNYEAWKDLMRGKGRVTHVVNEDNFAGFAEAHELAVQGRTEEAARIRQELGLGECNGPGAGTGTGSGTCAGDGAGPRWNR